MHDYIATFFTHYDALRFANDLRGRGTAVRLSPVPRSLSSSCGTCARFAFEGEERELDRAGLEQLVRTDSGRYLPVIDNR
ncbi:DUF3343 domain-containing protein [uncultured Anaerotruncus sp.]|uniref:DUF3343 domain-containing protein n=1 Tax=uncultured Anaerotruncus sp. TaxID=905011 RepID=UPI00280BB424|nr:DUF3343 domain-containing protein [uncultured Anaerotruncus sp.]